MIEIRVTGVPEIRKNSRSREKVQLWAEQGFLQKNNSELFLWHLTQGFWAAKLQELVVKLRKKKTNRCIDILQSTVFKWLCFYVVSDEPFSFLTMSWKKIFLVYFEFFLTPSLPPANLSSWLSL